MIPMSPFFFSESKTFTVARTVWSESQTENCSTNHTMIDSFEWVVQKDELPVKYMLYMYIIYTWFILGIPVLAHSKITNTLVNTTKTRFYVSGHRHISLVTRCMRLFFLSPTSNLKWLKNKLHRRVAWQPIHQCHVSLGLVRLLRSLRERPVMTKPCSIEIQLLGDVDQLFMRSTYAKAAKDGLVHFLPFFSFLSLSFVWSRVPPEPSSQPVTLCPLLYLWTPMFALRAYDFNSLFNNGSCCLQTVKKPSLSALIL